MFGSEELDLQCLSIISPLHDILVSKQTAEVQEKLFYYRQRG